MRGFALLRATTAMAVLVLVGAGALTVSAVRVQGETAGWVAHTHEVIAHLGDLSTALSSAESAQRAYLLTGETDFLDDHAQARARADAELQGIGGLTGDNRGQQQRLAQVRQALAQRFQGMDEARQLRDGGRLDEAMVRVATRGRAESLALREQLTAMRQAEDGLLQDRLRSARRAGAQGTVAAAGTALLALGLLLGLNRSASRHARQLSAERDELRRSREALQVQAEALRDANEQLRRSAELLERRVEERTAELADANAELEDFARTVAHDLRAPLRNIEGFAGALLEDEQPRLSDAGRDFVQRLAASAARLDRLVTDLLAYSRTARTALQLEPVAVQPLLESVLQDLCAELRRSGGEVQVEPPLPAVLAHPPTLGQVLANLLDNAVKFVAPGVAPQVRVSGRRDGDGVALSVQDNGIGIDPAQHERVFAVFERLHGQEQYAGTGIGLAIVRKAVERMGGRVRLDSRPGAGSRFEVWLRAAPQEGRP
jgi:signal transduction histidine kinase